MKRLAFLILLFATCAFAADPPLPTEQQLNIAELVNIAHVFGVPQGGGFGPFPIYNGVGAPSGGCPNGGLYTNNSNGNLYSCNAGTWILAGGGGGTIGTCATTDALSYYPSSTTLACDPGITTNTSGQLSATRVAGKVINGVSYSAYYPGSTLDVRVNACIVDAETLANGNTTGICSSEGEPSAQQTIAAQITVGDVGGQNVTWVLPAYCVWASTINDGTSSAIFQYSSSHITGSQDPFGCQIVNFTASSNGSTGVYALYRNSGTGVFEADHFWLIDDTNKTSSGALMVVQGSFDAGSWHDIQVQAEASGDTAGLLIGGSSGVVCCAATFRNMYLDGVQTGPTPLDIETTNPGVVSGITLSSMSVVHPKPGVPIIKINGSFGNSSVEFSGTTYLETSNSDTTTTPVQITGVGTVHFDLMEYGPLVTTTAPLVTISNAAHTIFSMRGFSSYATLPNAVVVADSSLWCASAPCNVSSDASGNMGFYTNAPMGPIQVTTATAASSPSIQITQGANGPAAANAPAVFNVSAAAAGGVAAATGGGFTGAPISLTTGVGSAAGATSGTGGTGGAMSHTTGAGGAGSAGTGNGGVGGAFNITTGAGGAHGGNTANQGGAGGAIGITMGAGAAGAATAAGGAAGAFTYTGGTGGAGGATSGTGGAGSDFLVTTGTGGAATAGSTTGRGGNFTVTLGAAGGTGTAGAPGTFTVASGPSTFSYSNAVSTSAMTFSGAPITGGSSTTTFPLFYMNDGAAPTGWNTNGTEIGINAPNGFTGDFLDFWVNGGSASQDKFSVNSGGSVRTVGFVEVGSLENVNNGNIFYSGTAPTISSGFNTSGQSISANNGTAAFTVTVGTGTATNTGVIGLPTATTGWVCNANNLTTAGAIILQTGAASTNTATLTNYGTTVGTPTNWTNSNVIRVSCFAY